MNFRELVDEWRAKGRRFVPQRTMVEVAEATKVSVPHLYCLMSGAKVARRHTVNKIARGLGTTVARVQVALSVSRDEAEVVS